MTCLSVSCTGPVGSRISMGFAVLNSLPVQLMQQVVLAACIIYTGGPQIVVIFEKGELHNNYCSRALKSRSKLRATIGLRAAFENFLLHQNSGLCTVTFGEKVLTLAKSYGNSIENNSDLYDF